MKTPPNRRSALKYLAGGSAAFVAANLNYRIQAAENQMDAPLKGKINHSVCRWCYGGIKLDDLAVAAKQMGISSIELLTPSEFATVKKYDLTCAMVTGLTGGYGIEKGWNRPENHEALVEQYQVLIKQTADAGLTNLICFSGNRAGLNDAEGLENCATGLKKIMASAEKHKVTLIMELLNSKVDHKDYMCDHTAWGVELCKKVGSDRLKLLYDIYHMQIMEGDVIRTIRDHHTYIGHYHTGGVPGRNEIDVTQELYYPAIMQAIVDTGYKGFVGQEFIPKREDKLASLKQGVMICDI
jgi:hydroxypyruvate isomerase